MLGGEEPTSTRRGRRGGFLAAMEEAGIPVDKSLLFDVSRFPESGSITLHKVMSLDNPPTAIACFTDFIALGALSGLHDLGLTPGKDVALMGCNGIPAGANSYIRLSTVNVQKSLIGKTTAELLLRRLEDPGCEPARVIAEPELVVRQTCGSYKVIVLFARCDIAVQTTISSARTGSGSIWPVTAKYL